MPASRERATGSSSTTRKRRLTLSDGSPGVTTARSGLASTDAEEKACRTPAKGATAPHVWAVMRAATVRPAAVEGRPLPAMDGVTSQAITSRERSFSSASACPRSPPSRFRPSSCPSRPPFPPFKVGLPRPGSVALSGLWPATTSSLPPTLLAQLLAFLVGDIEKDAPLTGVVEPDRNLSALTLRDLFARQIGNENALACQPINLLSRSSEI